MHMSFSQERKETATGEKLFCSTIMFNWASQVARMEQDPLATAGDIRDAGSIPGLGRFPRGGHGNPLQYFCLENPIHRVTKSWT